MKQESPEVKDLQRRENFSDDGRELCARCRRPQRRKEVEARTLNNELLCDDCVEDMDI